MSNDVIDFEALADIRQANIRGSQYQLKRRGDDKFIISNTGKVIIGHDPTKGANIKAGNGIVVIATLPKEDNRCTRGLLNGHLGNGFTSNTLEDALVDNSLEAETYVFEFLQEYGGLRYFKIVPVTEGENTDTTDDQEGDSASSEETVTDAPDFRHDDGEEEDASQENEISNENDDF